MPVYVCAVADCKSDSRKKAEKCPYMADVRGWAKFPSVKKEAKRRKLWEKRCRRGAAWRASRFHAVCSRHFIYWTGNGPSSSHPNPELFAYNDWGKKRLHERPPNGWQVNSVDAADDVILVAEGITETEAEVGPHKYMHQSSTLIGKTYEYLSVCFESYGYTYGHVIRSSFSMGFVCNFRLNCIIMYHVMGVGESKFGDR